MSGQSLTVVGSINEDITAVGERLPRPGETVSTSELLRTSGGKGANQAAAAARLGGRVRMIGARGDDEAGRRSVAALQHAGVDVTGVRVVDQVTGTALIVVDAAGENQIAIAAGANDQVIVDDSIDEAAAVLCQLEIPMQTIVDICSRANGFVAINAAPARPLPAAVIERCDLFIVNQEERAALPELARARTVAVTEGAAGAVLLRDDVEVARRSPPPTEVVSTVGAGDSFCAAIVLAMMSGYTDAEALEISCAVGAAAVASPCTQPAFNPLHHYLHGTAVAEPSSPATT
ncbi:ribokinase (plasmid) [Mycolicibacterium arabiense]|uniref:Ribokinase n=1 Tax=Mycolicibacterium arabiense TaxID=1286181 RepID=A0A7I7RQ25_9MYCO|nr:ribokinase [Mycolicibacterium arabiense]MCV7371991.1 ribokinase [Mycolicibacterium arabiense]BBY46688.1 ribokinase [Mycolicibacterium arabiense]